MTTLQKFPNAYADDGSGQISWVNPGNILTDNGQSAYTGASGTGYTATYSGWLRLGFDFGLDLPAGHEITAIQVNLDDLYKSSNTTGGAAFYIEYWNGTIWVPIDSTYVSVGSGAFSGGAVSAESIPVLAADVLAGWANGYGIRVKVGCSANQFSVRIDSLSVTVTYTPPAAPTVTAIAPASGSVAGGTFVTITGTGFQTAEAEPQDLVSGVTVGGVACTEVDVLSATSLTCRTGAHAAGAVDVVVTNAGGSGTLAGGFTYLSVVDAVVKVVKGGAVSGSSLHVATAWPTEPGEVTYGGPTELWDSLTVADVNAADFGFVIGATVGTGAQGRIDYMAARFHYTVPGVADPASYLAVLHVDADRATARPRLYQLPRSGYSISNDPTIDRRLSAGGEFRTSRRYAPGRTVEKLLYSRELWMRETANGGNTPGLQVWARTDDGTEFQLLDGAGQAATLRGSGPKEVFFPKGDQARCYYWQIIYRVPELAVGEVPAAYDIRDGMTRVLARPKKTEIVPFTLILSGGELEDRTSMRYSAAQQLAKLQELARPGRPSIEIRDPQGTVQYGSIVGLEYREAEFKEPKANVLVANLKLRVARYE